MCYSISLDLFIFYEILLYLSPYMPQAQQNPAYMVSTKYFCT